MTEATPTRTGVQSGSDPEQRPLTAEHLRWGACYHALSVLRQALEHEVRAALHPVSLQIVLLAELGAHPELPPDDLRRRLERTARVLGEGIPRLTGAITGTLDQIRTVPGPDAPRLPNLAGILADLEPMLQIYARKRPLELSVTAPEPPVSVAGDPLATRQALLLLLFHLLETTPDGGAVRVRLEPAGDVVRLTIAHDPVRLPDALASLVARRPPSADPATLAECALGAVRAVLDGQAARITHGETGLVVTWPPAREAS